MRKLGIFSYNMVKKNFIPLQIIIFNILWTVRLWR